MMGRTIVEKIINDNLDDPRKIPKTTEALVAAFEDGAALKAEMQAALEAYEALDDAHANCEECDGEVAPEACGACFLFADTARLRMRAVLDRVRGENQYGTWRPPEAKG